LGSLGDGSYSHLIGIGYSNELVKAAATAIGWDDAATGDNNIIVSDGASLKIKEADDDILTSGQALSINADEKNLSIGAGSDLTLYHDGTHSYIENITGKLIISSSAEPQYVCVSGSTMILGPLGDTGTTYTPSFTPIAGLSTITDCSVAGTSVGNSITAISDGQAGGEMIKLGTCDEMVDIKGSVVMLYSSKWYLADRTVSSGVSSSIGMLAMAMDIDGGVDEGLVLLKGIARIPDTLINDNQGDPASFDIGKPLYLSGSGQYHMSGTTISNDIQRVVGHVLDTDGTDYLIYFNPSNDWVKVS